MQLQDTASSSIQYGSALSIHRFAIAVNCFGGSVIVLDYVYLRVSALKYGFCIPLTEREDKIIMSQSHIMQKIIYLFIIIHK